MLGSLQVNSSNPWSGCGLGMSIRVSLGYCQQEDPDAVAGSTHTGPWDPIRLRPHWLCHLGEPLLASVSSCLNEVMSVIVSTSQHC